MRGAADVAALAQHAQQTCRGERGELGQGLQQERPVRVDAAGAQWRRDWQERHGRAGDAEHPTHDIAVNVQLPGDRAHAPLLDRVQAQDLRDQLRGCGHGVTRWAPSGPVRCGAGSPDEASAAARHRSAGNARVLRERRRWGRARWSGPCRVCMSPVEQRAPQRGNPGASRYLLLRCCRCCCRRHHRANGAGASAVTARRARCAQGASTGSDVRPCGAPHCAPDASRRARSSGCRDRSDCTRQPGRGTLRTGTNGLDGPHAPPN